MGATPRETESESAGHGIVTAIVLAAGGASRMRKVKPLVPIAGRPMLGYVLSAVRASSVDDVVLVLGHEAERVRRALVLEGTRVVINPSFAEGMSSSIRAGLAAANPGADGYLMVLGDQPFVAAATMDALIRARTSAKIKIVIPTYRGVRGNPVLLDRTLSGEMSSLTGDQGCRAIFGHHDSEILDLAVDDPGVLIDIDTPSQAERAAHVVSQGEALESLIPQGNRVSHRGPHDRILSHGQPK